MTFAFPGPVRDPECGRLLDVLLRRYFAPNVKPVDWEWTMIGDNWLMAWNVARQWEHEYGIDHQRTLRVISRRYGLLA